MSYAVTCLDTEGFDYFNNVEMLKRVRATSRDFETREEAETYAKTVCPSRAAEVTYLCGYCGDWRKEDHDGAVWPYCVTCGAT
jgi:hypothetical protein